MNKEISKYTINDSNWESLLHAIDCERVVPIIGGAFYYTDSDECLEDYVLEELKKRYKCRRKDADFTMLSDIINYDNIIRRNRGNGTGNATNIYQEIYKEIKSVHDSQRLKCKQEIVKFLSINKFPLVLTTSCFPGLKAELKEIYGNVDEIVYDKSARSDIGGSLSATKPTLYYMFGKVNLVKKSFMVTEDDLLDYMHLWHNLETRPNRLSDYLKDKFLLVLGCDYPNWLFRFFWHSIRNFNLVSRTLDEQGNMQGIVALENVKADKELTKFLSRIQTQYYENSMNFIDEFLRKWNGWKKDCDTSPRDIVDDNVDLFISYAHEDLEEVRRITRQLKNLGADVWLDERELKFGDPFPEVIKEKIRRTKRFVPILSRASIHRNSGFYRREWEMAVEESKNRYGNGKPFFAPIVIDDSDVNSYLIPEKFREIHIISSSDSSFESEAKALIRNIRSYSY